MPVDGEVVEGHSYIDESMITGEPVPVEKIMGQQVVGGHVLGRRGGQGEVSTRIRTVWAAAHDMVGAAVLAGVKLSYAEICHIFTQVIYIINTL